MTSALFPSRIRFGSFLQYGRHGDTPEARASKNIIFSIKADRISHKPPLVMADLVVAVMARDFAGKPLVQILNGNVTAVPMPRSAPLLRKAVWGPRTVCEHLVSKGLAREWQPLIERTEPIEKSAFVKNTAERPTPLRQFETMRVVASTVRPDEIVLVDDVITLGSTFAGAAARIREAYPGVPVRAFAVSRTMSVFTRLEDPCVGDVIIEPDGSKSRRQDDEPQSGRLFD